jgi:hypothetical protein
MATIHATVNFFGAPLEVCDIDKLTDHQNAANQLIQLDKRLIELFLEVPLANLPRTILERYAEISPQKLYQPVLPHTDKLYERLLSPLKSAKRCYCLGEFLATIELSAHIGEMLATLVWHMSTPSLNGQPITTETEKDLWGGKTFEKLGQNERTGVLRAFNLINDSQKALFDFLRTTRRKYFHLWSGDLQQAKPDALTSFFKIMQLIDEILQIKIGNGTLLMNPKLLQYVQSHSK